MRFKSILKSGLLIVLAMIMATTMFACKDTKKEQKNEKGELPEQHKNMRYYFQQGYRTDWKIQQADPEGYLVNEETNLVLQLVPVEVTKDEDGNVVEQGAVIEGVEYTVYAYKSSDVHHQNDAKKIAMTSTQQEVLSWLLDDKDETFYFNTHYYTDAPRETFRVTSEPVIFTAVYSKLQFLQVTYQFTRDGDDWNGVLCFVMKGQDFFVVTYETKANLFEEYKLDYDETIGDFRKTGWETA